MSNASYAAFDGVTPAALLTQAVALLRGAYHFGGVVMSDDVGAALQPTGEGPGAVALAAPEAGVDLLYITGPPSEHQAAYAAVLAAAQRSAGVHARVHEALVRDRLSAALQALVRGEIVLPRALTAALVVELRKQDPRLVVDANRRRRRWPRFVERLLGR